MGRLLPILYAVAVSFSCGESPDPPPQPSETPRDSVAPAVVSVLAGFDDEGIREEDITSPSSPGPYISGDTVYADIAMLTPLLAPAATVTVSNSMLLIDGEDTALAFRRHGTALYVPVREFSRRYRAYTRVHQNHATVWPHERLCEYLRRKPDPRAPVFQEAQAEGLFAGCN